MKNRKIPRHPGFDYARDEYYFITLCTYGNTDLFGLAPNLTPLGRLAENRLLQIPNHYPGVQIDKHIIMPNHLHAIIILGCNPEKQGEKNPNLSTVIGGYKSGVTREIHQIKPGLKVWQRSFYDRIIRDEKSYRQIWQYIDSNASPERYKP